MTDLTEKRKKGELIEGFYYVKSPWSDEIEVRYVHNGTDEYECIVAPVPGYEEWQASENYIDYLKQCISVYESKDNQATETSIAYNELAKENEELKEILERHKKATAKAQIRSCDLEIINQQLKELLKECRPYFDALVEKRLKLEYIPQVYKLLTKIDNAIGEKH